MRCGTVYQLGTAAGKLMMSLRIDGAARDLDGALFAARRNRKVGAWVVFYGRDNSVTSQVVAELDRRLTELGKAHAFHPYPRTAHAFFNDELPEVYDRAAASDARTKTLALLRREIHA